MANKAFLYTGATFLVMMALLISVNYLMLAKHTGYEAKAVVLEVDRVNNLASDARHAIVLDQNNAMADAFSDAAYLAIVKSNSDPFPFAQIMKRLNPLDTFSEAQFSNISKWLLNYTNITLSKMEDLTELNVNFSSPVFNVLKINTGCKGPPGCGGAPQLPYIFSVNYFANISYNLTFNGTVYLQTTQTLQKNKSLTVSQTSTNPKKFCIYVTDNDKGTSDFNKQIICDPNCAIYSSC